VPHHLRYHTNLKSQLFAIEAMVIASRNDDAIPVPPITDRGESATGVEPKRPSTPVASQSPLSESDNHNVFGFSFQVSKGKQLFLPSSLKNPLFFSKIIVLPDFLWDDIGSRVRAVGVRVLLCA
jgi:hypothetical protein